MIWGCIPVSSVVDLIQNGWNCEQTRKKNSEILIHAILKHLQ